MDTGEWLIAVNLLSRAAVCPKGSAVHFPLHVGWGLSAVVFLTSHNLVPWFSDHTLWCPAFLCVLGAA